MLITDEFRVFFGDDELAEIDAERSTVYGLNANLEIVLVNNAWMEFARENQAPDEFFEKYTLGSSYLECLPSPMRDFFEKHIRHSMDTEEVWTFDYLCPSPEKLRKFHMQVMPLPAGVGCLISNATLVEMPHPDDNAFATPTLAAIRQSYVGEGGLVTQCSHCRRTRHVSDPKRWDWIPQLAEHAPEKISHGICPTCFSYFYPSVDRG